MMMDLAVHEQPLENELARMLKLLQQQIYETIMHPTMKWCL
jgi:hypothetical protein